MPSGSQEPSLPRTASVPAAELPGLNQLLSLAVGVVVIAALFFAQEVLIPITLAVLLSFVLAPAVELLRNWHVPRVPAVLLAVVLAFAVIVSLASVMGMQVASLAGNLPQYQSTIAHKVETVRSAGLAQVGAVLKRFGKEFNEAQPAPAPAPPGRAAPGNRTLSPGAQAPIPVEVHQPEASPLDILERVVSPLLGPLEKCFIVVIVSIFILLQREDLRDRLIRLFGSNDLHRTTVAMDDAARRLSRYFLSQLCINAGFGAVIGAGLMLIGLPSAWLWAIFAGLLRFVPYVGSTLAAVLPVALAAAVDPGWSMMVWTGALFIGCDLIVGQFIEPLVYGHSTGLSPVSVVIAAIFWTWLWGPVGLILSTPLTLCLVIVGRYVERLEFLDVMLGDRPALTPVENFYQRMLAGDPDEAQDQAEILLKEHSLSSYYDNVVVEGLRLAASDLARGTIGPERLDKIHSAMRTLVEELGEAVPADADPNPNAAREAALQTTTAEKKLPSAPAPTRPAPSGGFAPAWRGDTPVLCIAGRGSLDGATADMLGQLLRKHGIQPRMADHEAASRERIGSLDTTGVAMICLVYLEIAGNASHLRYLIRRLRRRMPRLKVLVGLWPGGGETGEDERLRSAIGADCYATSLGEAVSICLAEAANHPGEPATVAA
ncbi:MAG: AI-2E family transporter [Acetobacteraceae bacterium]|nr:AI-2E family transporter [Acetobacteraceae bacterium]